MEIKKCSPRSDEISVLNKCESDNNRNTFDRISSSKIISNNNKKKKTTDEIACNNNEKILLDNNEINSNDNNNNNKIILNYNIKVILDKKHNKKEGRYIILS